MNPEILFELAQSKLFQYLPQGGKIQITPGKRRWSATRGLYNKIFTVATTALTMKHRQSMPRNAAN